MLKTHAPVKENSDERSELSRIYLWSFALRCLVGIMTWLLADITQVALIEDAARYERLGALVALDWLSGRSSPWLNAALQSAPSGDAWLMVVFIAAFYWITGGIRAVPLLIAIY